MSLMITALIAGRLPDPVRSVYSARSWMTVSSVIRQLSDLCMAAVIHGLSTSLEISRMAELPAAELISDEDGQWQELMTHQEPKLPA